MTSLIILDRDGVINHDSLRYIKSPDEFILIPESIDAIARLTRAGYLIAIATNQSGVSRGLYSLQTLEAIHQRLHHEVAKAGGEIAIIEYCIHLPEERCFCRKPNPGMLYAIAKKLNRSLRGVPFVGDRVSDIQAALTTGAAPIIVLSSMTDREGLKAYPDVPVYQSLSEYVQQLLSPL